MTRDELILNNQGLIGYTIKRLGLGNLYNDVYDLGLIGLIKAVDSWDKNKCTLATYASVCIRNEILMFVRKQKYQTISFETPVTDNLVLQDTITDDYDFTEEIIISDTLTQIYKSFKILSYLEQECLIRYYGLFGEKKQLQTEIGKNLNISQSYVQRVIARAIKKLKKEVGTYE